VEEQSAGAFRPAKGRDAKDSLNCRRGLGQVIRKPVAFAGDCVGEIAEKAIATINGWRHPVPGKYPFHKEEKRTDPAFVAELAKLEGHLGQRRVLGAHRAHASTEGLGHNCRPMPAVPCRPNSTRSAKALEARPSPDRDHRRRQGLHQDRSSGKPRQQGRWLVIAADGNTSCMPQGFGIGKSLAEKDLAATALRIVEKAEAANAPSFLPCDAVVAFHFAANSPSHAYGLDAIPPTHDPRRPAAVDRADSLPRATMPGTLVWNGRSGRSR